MRCMFIITDEHFAQTAETGKNKVRGRDGREIGATSSIIVANRAWIMTRERTPNDKSRAERHARQTMGRIGRDSVRARFSLSSRLGDGDVKLCTIRRGPLSISVYVMFVSRTGLTAGRVCHDYADAGSCGACYARPR